MAVLYYIWIPAAAFAHVFAAIWLVQTLFLYSPSLRRNILKRFHHTSRIADEVSSAPHNSDSGRTAAEDTGDEVLSGVSLGDDDDDVEQGVHIPSLVMRRFSSRISAVSLEWRNIGCAYKSAAGVKKVLDGVYGKANPGEMQALLGPSGAGKSTLMDILAMRKSVGTLTGQLLVNGQPCNKQFIRKTAYVPQDDNFVPTMTTLETLSFYASMILPDRLSAVERQTRVMDVLGVVGLGEQKGTLVGGQLPGGLLLRGLSGGERKRLSIAAGILASPSVVFLDEPTSGLDSFSALTVMGYLKEMACQAGHIVMASIHQPRSAIWTMFDKVTLLSHGMLMYHGPCDELLEWFSGELSYPYVPNMHGVASDWVMDLVSTGFNKPKKFYGNTIRSREELEAAARKFRHHYLKQMKLNPPATPCPSTQSQQNQLGAKTILKKLKKIKSGGREVPLEVVVPQDHLSGLPNWGTGPPEEASSMGDGYQEGALQGKKSRGVGAISGEGPLEPFSPRVNTHQGSNPLMFPPFACPGGLSQGSSASPGLKPLSISGPLHPGSNSSGHKHCYDCAPPTMLASPSSSSSSSSSSSPSARASSSTLEEAIQKSDHWLEKCERDQQRKYAVGVCRQYRSLVWREFLAITRNPADVAGRVLTFTWVALMVGLVYIDVPPGAESIRLRLNLIFSTLCFFLLMPYISMSLYTADKQFYTRDVSAKLYRPIAYYSAKVTATAPFHIICALVFSLTVYGMTGLRDHGTAIVTFATVGTLLSLIAIQVLHLASTLAPNQDMAFMVGIAWTAVNMLMSNFFLAFWEMNFQWLSQLRYISAMAYAFEGMAVAELGQRTFSCAQGLDPSVTSLMPQLVPDLSRIPAQAINAFFQRPMENCEVDAQGVLGYFRLHLGVGPIIGILVAYLMVLHVATFMALARLSKRENR